MDRQGDEIHIDETDASAGQKTGHMRWVLGLGLLIAVAAMSVAWIIPASSEGDVESAATVSGTQEAMSGDDGDATDSIVSDRVEDAPKPEVTADEAQN